jgi:hypothetical protein
MYYVCPTTSRCSHYCQLVHRGEPEPEYLSNRAFRRPHGLAGRGIDHPLYAVHLAFGISAYLLASLFTYWFRTI